MSDVYEQLRLRLDDLAVGFPGTESKIEIRLLKQLFAEEEAEFFVQLQPLMESPADAAKRLKKDPDQVAERMEQMAKKGLLFRQRKDDRVRYAPFYRTYNHSKLRSCERYPLTGRSLPTGPSHRMKMFYRL
jgi:hypothetical protein